MFSSTPARLLGAALALGFILGIASLAFQSCQGPSGVNPAIHDTAAALASSRKPDSVFHAAAVAAGDSGVIHARAADPAIRQLQLDAARQSHRADSLADAAVLATSLRDSANNWRLAFTAEKQRANMLDSALTLRTQERDSALESSARYRTADSSSQARLTRVEGFNRTLSQELERLSHCRILPGIPCPSRKQLLIVGGTVGAVAERGHIVDAAKRLLHLP